MQRVLIKAFGVFLFLMAMGGVAYAQYNIQHQAPIALERNAMNTLEFDLPGLTQSDIQQARMFYRYDGDISYQQREVNFQNGVFRTSFNIDDQNASTLEYYFEVILLSGEQVYYPSSFPAENPVVVEIVDSLEQEKPQLEGVEYTILAPEPGVGVTSDDVLIAIALFYDITTLEPGEFKLYLDNQDITGEADTSAYYISYVPRDLRSGTHHISLEYATAAEDFAVVDWQFSVVAPGQASFRGFDEGRLPQISAELSARNQVIAGDINNAYTGRTRVSGQYGLLRYSLNGYLTSQESARLQPQNRYGIDLSLGKWWNFEAGHVYPLMSQFTISGRRVHGLNTSLHLLDDRLNFQFIYGELDRSITNQYDSLIVEEVVDGSGTTVDRNYMLTYQDGGRGTFKRKIRGGKIAFGNEEKFQMGFHALKIQDDTTSIFNVRNYLDIMNSDLTLNNNLTPDARDSLQANPNLLDVRGGNINPRDNIVMGTDLKMGFMNNRIRFESEAVMSALNNNIYGGPLTIAKADELGFDIDQGVSDLLEQLSWLIIINENMDTLPLKLSEDENGDLKGEPFFPSSILAANSELSYRQPKNNARLQYRWIGPNFNSLANSTVRKDIAGFTLSDRLNLLANRVYLTLGYENLNDNVTGSRDATTKTVTYRTNASWYPVDRKLPRVSLGFRYRTRDNEIERQNYLLPDDLVNAAVQNLRQEVRTINGQDSLVTLVTSTPRTNNTTNVNASITQQFEWLSARNDVSISVSNLKTTDQVFAFGDVRSTAFSLNLTSRFFDHPLETRLGFTYNRTESGSGQNKINIAGFYAGGNYSFMDNRLSVNGRLAITGNRIQNRELLIRDFSDPNTQKDDYYELGSDVDKNKFQTYVIQAGARFDIDDYHALIFDANLTNVSGGGRANDRIVQLRYVFRF
ncbi:MAG: hypothetical protein HUJ22_13230 [Gracilimonas sp.]|nr:hypothetical protein [Gracilimonas sp.]